MNDLLRYPFGTISKSFYLVLPLGLFMSPPPLSFDTYKEQRTERAKRQKYGRRERKNLDLKREPHEIVQIITKNDT
jgi:hypothetical protein